jgi:putative nucleotidyltransferase with HDIG domain
MSAPVITSPSRSGLSEELVRRLAAAMRAAQLYAPTHPLVAKSVAGLTELLGTLLASSPSLTIGIIGDDLVVADVPIPNAAENLGELMRRLRQSGVERIVFDRGVAAEEVATLVRSVASGDAASMDALARLARVRVGRLQVEEKPEGGDMATFRRLYDDASKAAGSLWESAATEGKPDADAARGLVDSLAEAVAQNRTALLALTALKNYDNYTFTHMVNVSILTMGQARGLGIDGTALREFGLAALMHDIGKVKTPNEILNKPGKLTDQEFDILKRHTVDGAEILKSTPEIPPLAPVVAFEHHLRSDGTGYPHGVARTRLNLGTSLCGIADVYDAMRSQRVYQEAHASDRILAVLQRNDGRQFDQHLVRRFVQLVGIYPAGNLVKLDTGDIAVVLQPYAPDPYRPKVKLLMRASGHRLERPFEINLWEAPDGLPQTVRGPVDPATVDLDPLSHL